MQRIPTFYRQFSVCFCLEKRGAVAIITFSIPLLPSRHTFVNGFLTVTWARSSVRRHEPYRCKSGRIEKKRCICRRNVNCRDREILRDSGRIKVSDRFRSQGVPVRRAGGRRVLDGEVKLTGRQAAEAVAGMGQALAFDQRGNKQQTQSLLDRLSRPL